MNTSTLLALAILLIFSSAALGQNLVPNGSFEEFVDCPEGLADLQAAGWSQARGSCDYYNACAEPCGVGVPCNVAGFQYAVEGNAYAGFIQFRTPNPEYREHMTCELGAPLVEGVEYFFSMYLNRGTSNLLNKASNGQGFYLSHELHSSTNDENPLDNPSPVSSPVFWNTEVLEDSTNWVQIKTSFIADSDYSYLIVGGFMEEAILDTLDLGVNDPTGEAYYFVDEVRLSTDQEFAWEVLNLPEILHTLEERAPYPNPSSGILHLPSTSTNQNLGVEIFDMQGLLVAKQFCAMGKLDISDLPSGIYHLVINRDGVSHSHRIIKTEQ